jgi:hypothetical protein
VLRRARHGAHRAGALLIAARNAKWFGKSRNPGSEGLLKRRKWPLFEKSGAKTFSTLA